MAKSPSQISEEMLRDNIDMVDISGGNSDGVVPFELQGEDVYDTLILFRNEEIAVNYCCEHYSLEKSKLLEELYEEEWLRKEYGREKYLRTASLHTNSLILDELLNGTYILWKAY